MSGDRMVAAVRFRTSFIALIYVTAAMIIATHAAWSYTSDTDWAGANWTLSDGDIVAGVHTNVGHLSIPLGATVTVMNYDPDTGDFGKVAIFADSASIQGTLSADAAGFPSRMGPGAGDDRGGGAYGGRGGVGHTLDYIAEGYGSVETPDQLGSGGGDYGTSSGGRGGGALRLDVGDHLAVNGTLSAHGGNAEGQSGGGSGGSIWLIAESFGGSGTIAADGGTRDSSGGSAGGGGRIALDTAQNTFTGVIRAAGSDGRADASRHGTFNFQSDPDHDLVIAQDIALPPGTNWVFRSLTVKSGASFEIQSLPGTNAVAGYPDEIASRLTVLHDVTIETGATLSANGLGYLPETGPGAGDDRGGGAYGGRGGVGIQDYIAEVYGSANTPDRLGSGGGSNVNAGGSGGGAVILNVGGVLTVNGVLSARGGHASVASNSGGGGSGGSIWLTADGLAGSGVIHADGGNADGGGAGGGGGRIALDTAQNTFHGIIRASGKPGPDDRGRHGTLNISSDAGKDLIIAHDIALPPGTNWTFKSLTVKSGATFDVQSKPGTAAVGWTNEWPAHLSVLSSLTIETNAALSADGLGYLKDGEGMGSHESGASHGGRGGGSGFSTEWIADPYGSTNAPIRLGSGAAGTGPGGGGGGLLLDVAETLKVDGTLSAHGGHGGGGSNRGGGGSGGSLWLRVGKLEGIGSIGANGGSSTKGGGGGGRIAVWHGPIRENEKDAILDGKDIPRLHILETAPESFLGLTTAYGGPGGANPGEDGTVRYIHMEQPASGTLFIIR